MVGFPASSSPISSAWWGCLKVHKVSNKCPGVGCTVPAKQYYTMSLRSYNNPVRCRRSDWSKSRMTARLNALYKG